MTSLVLRGLTPLQALGLGHENDSASDDLRIAAIVKEFGSVEAAVVAATNAYLTGDE